jgi:predicted RNase H-like HicB family nuclease
MVSRCDHGFFMNITVVLHDCSLDGETGFAATCVEFPEANGQGETREDCIANLKDAVKDVLQFRREEAERSLGER